MDDETLNHVFEPFFTTKSLVNAEGLGLANAYGFVRQSGGAITVNSMPKRGSTFEIYLPQASTVSERVRIPAVTP
jgi:signal transduction histidine kinase